MFILKRQDVEISGIQHPKTGQNIPVLNYQDQTFRLISVFNAKQAEEARSFWRDLTDNRGKACVLLEEPDRYSVWGKIRVEQLDDDHDSGTASPFFTQAALILLQEVYYAIEDLLGNRQAGAFQKDVTKLFQQWNFPDATAPEAVAELLEQDPLEGGQVPPWQEHHLNTLLQELYRIGKEYFGNTSFVGRAIEALKDMPDSERSQFVGWLNQSPLGKMWETV